MYIVILHIYNSLSNLIAFEWDSLSLPEKTQHVIFFNYPSIIPLGLSLL